MSDSERKTAVFAGAVFLFLVAMFFLFSCGPDFMKACSPGADGGQLIHADGGLDNPCKVPVPQ